jgi:hypothetical protein
VIATVGARENLQGAEISSTLSCVSKVEALHSKQHKWRPGERACCMHAVVQLDYGGELIMGGPQHAANALQSTGFLLLANLQRMRARGEAHG